MFGAMVLLGIQQIKDYEPGDADWGAKLAAVTSLIDGVGLRKPAIDVLEDATWPPI